jgi:hypothetical protein
VQSASLRSGFASLAPIYGPSLAAGLIDLSFYPKRPAKSLNEKNFLIYSLIDTRLLMNRFCIGFLLVYSLFFPCIYAETKRWTGEISENWSADLNWNPIGAPITGDAIVFATDGAITTNVNITIDPASITFQNGVECSITGRTLTISDSTCPLVFQDASTGQWLDGTTVNFGGPLELQGSGSTARFSTITGAGNLSVDQGMTCNLTQPAGAWTSSTTTLEGTLNLLNSNCLTTTSSLVFADNTSAQLNIKYWCKWCSCRANTAKFNRWHWCSHGYQSFLRVNANKRFWRI